MIELEKWISIELDHILKLSLDKYFSGSPMHPMLEYHFALSGKRLRPLAVLLSAISVWKAKGIDCEDHRKSALPYALAVEFVHNATLIHDDIQDGDEFRRGRPALWKQFGIAQAINCGDALFFAAERLIQDADYQSEITLRLLEVLARETFSVINGQSCEFALKKILADGNEAITIPAYEEMVRGKTSALFAMPYIGGAIIAGESKLSPIESAASDLGFAFQIQDDLLDLWGNKGRSEVGSDIAEGKLSYPMVLALSGDSLLHERLRSILLKAREQTSEADIRWAIEELELCGAKEKAIAECESRLRNVEQAGEAFQPIAKLLRNTIEKF